MSNIELEAARQEINRLRKQLYRMDHVTSVAEKVESRNKELLAARVEAVKALHTKRRNPYPDTDHCDHCLHDWPCATIIALEV